MTSLQNNSRRSPVYGRGGMVAASQPLAVAAGLQLLSQGGSAADAAVATAAALNVTEPGSTGLGGDAFVLYYEAAKQRVYALNGSGRAPAALTLERLHREGYSNESLPTHHAYTVTVPGACAAWCDLIERFGRLPLADSLTPAIRLAEEGFPAALLTSHYWQIAIDSLLLTSPNGRELTSGGRAPRAGEIFRNPGFARTLRAVSDGGKAGFYDGPVAEAIAAEVQRAGGCLTVADLASHTSTWDEPIAIHYRGKRVWECPPNGQGLTALMALNILSGYDLSSMPPLSAKRLHLCIEAMRLAFADAFRYIADPAFADIPLEGLLSDAYAAERRQQINPQLAARQARYGNPPSTGHDTVYFSVVDAQGNACSFINSLYMQFGSGIVPEGWGFALQNRGHNFSLQPGHFNALAPGKRPYHTIIPAMLTNPDGSLYASLGVMGGFMQPQGHLQVISALLDDGDDPQAALDRPRFCMDPFHSESKTALEEGVPAETISTLGEMGHSIEVLSGLNRSRFGRGQVICRDSTDGVLSAGSDPRSDGCAMTLI
jgi:gamma-glutamyltranspeptidase / glutathione hydrolase